MSNAIEVAAEAVSLAARVTRAVQQDLITAETLEKKDKSPVTVADYAAQAVVSSVLARAFPDVPLVGEEDAADLRDPANEALCAQVVAQVRKVLGDAVSVDDVLSWIDRGDHDGRSGASHWTLDPIDGTKGFLRGEQYAIALGRIDGGKVVLGALGCPNMTAADGSLGIVLTAERGKGVFQNGVLLPRQGAGRDFATASLCESVESGHSNHDHSALIKARLGVGGEPVRIDSQAKYAAVARGDAQIYLRLPTRPGYQEKIWDHAAGMICVEENGGTVTDVDGKPLDFGQGRTLAGNRGVIATSGVDHASVVAATRAVLANG